LLVVETVFTFQLFFEERFVMAIYNLPLDIEPNMFDPYSRISQALLNVQQNAYEFVAGKFISQSFLNLFYILFLENELGNMKLKILKSGMLLSEFSFRMYGFAVNRRRLRPGNDDVSVSSSTTPPIPRRVSPRVSAIENAQCNVCMQKSSTSEQRFWFNCRQMLCTSCCDNIAVRSSNDISFECPFCRQHFVQDIVDLFDAETI
jgi:hypothetical protein